MSRCLILRVSIYTDGDFSIHDPNNRLKIFYPWSDVDDHSVGEALIVFHHNRDDNAEDDVSYVENMFEMARTYLQILLTSIQVSFTHYWILPDIYDFLRAPIDSIHHHSQQYISRMSGNYEGTEIAWVIGDPDDIISNNKSVVRDLQYRNEYNLPDIVHHFYNINEIYP